MNLENLKVKAIEFVSRVENEEVCTDKITYERALMSIFGVKGGIPEHPIMLNGFQVYVDYVLPGQIMLIYKRSSETFDETHKRALEYIENQYERDRPKILILCDNYKILRVYDLEKENEYKEFDVKDLADNLNVFKKAFE